jgi:hypothetical protein
MVSTSSFIKSKNLFLYFNYKLPFEYYRAPKPVVGMNPEENSFSSYNYAVAGNYKN